MKVLFIAHDAHRAGAQLLLLNFLKWLRNKHPDFVFEILLCNGGDLKADFCALAKSYELQIALPTFIPFFLKKVIEYLYKFFTYLRLSNNRYSLFYSNTIVNGNVLEQLKKYRDVPVVTHVHEMNVWIDRCGKKNFLQNLRYTDLFIAASEQVKDVLVQKGVTASSVTVIYEYIDVDDLNNSQKADLRAELGIPKYAKIIGASGYEYFRKGKDLFHLLAIQLKKICKDELHFVWIGGDMNAELLFDMDKLNGEIQIHYLSHRSNAYQYFHDFDIFAMLSREDPFPVVNLEAAFWKVPVVCFDQSGGTIELLERNSFLIAPYLDITSLAEKINHLLVDYNLRKDIGEWLKKKVEDNYTIDIVGEALLRNISQLHNQGKYLS